VTDHANIVWEALRTPSAPCADCTHDHCFCEERKSKGSAALDALVAERDARGWSRKEYAALLVRAEAAEVEVKRLTDKTYTDTIPGLRERVGFLLAELEACRAEVERLTTTQRR